MMAISDEGVGVGVIQKLTIADWGGERCPWNPHFGWRNMWTASKETASKNFGIHSPSAHLLLGERILKVWYWKPHSKNWIFSALRAEENVVLCKTPTKGSLFQFLSFSQWLGERQPNVYCEDFGQKGLTTMYQLLGPLSTSKENVLTSRCHVSQLFSQWAISTGEKSPKSYWGTFFYFHLKFWKVLMKPQLSIKEFLQNQSVKKKIFSPSLKVTHPLR